MKAVVIGASLATYAVYLYLFDANYIVKGAVPALAGSLLLINRPNCIYWRFFTVLSIVLGTLQTLFHFWTVLKVQDSQVYFDKDAYYNLVADTNVPAAITSLTIGAYLQTGKVTVTRQVVLYLLLAGLVYAIGQATLFYYTK